MNIELKKLMLYLILPIYLSMAYTSIYFREEISFKKHYVHSDECQTNNFLALDCFDHCNDETTHLDDLASNNSGSDQLKFIKFIDKFYSVEPDINLFFKNTTNILFANFLVSSQSVDLSKNSPPPKV